jgi:hypothetical protein
MMLLSCVNCCHNPLQSDAVGTQYGYCTQHRRLLLVPAQLTCGRHLRKDLPIVSASNEREKHQRRFTPAAVVDLFGAKPSPVNGGYTSASPADQANLADDKVSEIIFEYGELESKIASMAQLRVLEGARAELAMLSLGRGYVNWCVERNGSWMSGLHLLWWTRKRLASYPDVRGTDLRTASPLPIARQIGLAQWSIVMMRLLFISDVASYAPRQDRMGRLSKLAELAAEGTREISPGRLVGWVAREALPAFDAVLPRSRYDRLAKQLRSAAASED